MLARILRHGHAFSARRWQRFVATLLVLSFGRVATAQVTRGAAVVPQPPGATPVTDSSTSASRGRTTRVELWLQPGMATGEFVSPPPSEPSTTGFNLRVSAVVMRGSRWFTPIFGANLTPYGSTGASRRNTNEPSLFAGTIVNVIPARTLGGWLQLDAPLLLSHTPGGGGDNNTRRYGRDLVAEIAVTAFMGEKIFREFGRPLASLRAYAIIDQTLTPNRGSNGRRDRFNPLAYYGVTIPIGAASRGAP